VNSLLLFIEKSKLALGGEEHIFSFGGTLENLGRLPWKIWGGCLGKSVAGLGFPRSRHQKR
jgi:hypothetical protein